MKKAWMIFLLVLIISAQFFVLSSFHEVDAGGFTYNVSVITIAKFDYVGASFVLTVSPGISALNGSVTAVSLLMPNGTHVSVRTSPYSFTLVLHRSGDFWGNGGVSGPAGVSESNPMNVSISANVSNATQYEASMGTAASSTLPGLQYYFVVVYGDASVSVNGFGVAL